MRRIMAIAVVAGALTLAPGAVANPYLQFGYAKQQLTKFVVSRLVAADERKGMDVTWHFDACWRVSSWRVNCHLRLQASGTVPTTGDTVTTYCSGTWTAYNDRKWFRIRNVTWACN